MTTRTMPLFTAAAVALITLAACGGDHGSSSHGAATPVASPSAGAVFADADVAFAQHMVVHHRQAVEMAVLAPERAASAEVKKLAAAIEAAQAPEISTMTGWLGAWGAAVPEAGHDSGHETMPGMMSDADMTALAAAKGAAFDERFLTLMIAHHEGAITMAGEASAKGANPEAKALAAAIVTDQRAEIAEMRALLAE
ncbi:uncharacterized protein (DUF305 family) [Actinoplanes campanulatus]|uniref:Uncharacterized protein (DUF305 family) n=1 Tax=Actinoplanes campanulatus TaxID=113559 RepID=A0A7W5FKB2_9ACTN|nr:DUF305 domain-containing protein [Actinoplanes campanulatus]MBB3101502.1 uncharacterized protein (DUF305 family) [Actinoplanes campanulatus]GGN50551.1 lipoprotein [Actinoplanes campanulatus]GID42098.1 lipoprotein [Actinoplanes campanulatus]